MDNNQKSQQQGLQIDLSPEVSKGIYSNFAIISHSKNEFVADFAMLLPGMPKAQVGSRVILAPEHAKRLLAALNDNITRYEKEFGKIELPQQGGARTVAPFGTPKGEA